MTDTDKKLEALKHALETTIRSALLEIMHEETAPQVMCDVITVLEQLHGRSIIIAAMALIASSEGSPETDREIRKFVADCEEDFVGNLRESLPFNLKENGLRNIYDPNQALREAILSGKPN